MRFWRSPVQYLGGILMSLCLTLVLHACQPDAPPSVSVSPDIDLTPSSTSAPTVTSSSQSISLPPATKAIVDRVPGGLADPPRGDMRLVVISDLNGVYGSTDYDSEVKQAITLLPFWKPDMVLCSGDMVAGQDPTLSEPQLKAMWAAFDEHIAAPLRQANLPYGFTIGNHDASSAKSVAGGFLFERERTVASDYWNDAAHDPGVEFVDRFEFPFYYTFRLGDVFVLAWDGSSHHIPPEKLAWVEQALESPEAQSAKIKILLGHLPLYAITVGRDTPGEVMENADQLRDMLERHNVHTYVSGHHHAYYPAHKGNLQLLHMGILGSGPRPFIDSTLSPLKTLTVLDINFASPDLTTYTTYNMQTLQLIELADLPRLITGHNGMVLRRDVEINDLTASEQSLCERRLSAELCRA